MGFLRKIFNKPAGVTQLPSGTITMDRAGNIVSSTVTTAYPAQLLQVIGKEVLALLREARAAQIPLAEISIHYASLRVTARELRGGVIIFLFPQTALSPASN